MHYGKNQDRKINGVAVHKKLPAEWLRLDSAKEIIEQNQAEIKTKRAAMQTQAALNERKTIEKCSLLPLGCIKNGWLRVMP